MIPFQVPDPEIYHKAWSEAIGCKSRSYWCAGTNLSETWYGMSGIAWYARDGMVYSGMN